MDDEIAEATDALVASLERGNASSAARIYTDDATLLAPGARVIRGRREIEAYWNAGIAVGLSAVQFERELLEAAGASMVEAGRYAIAATAARTGRIVERGAFLVVHLRVADGSWRRAVEVFAPTELSSASNTNDKEEPRWAGRDLSRRALRLP
jgi:ketosteroid isomerase-like protein